MSTMGPDHDPAEFQWAPEPKRRFPRFFTRPAGAVLTAAVVVAGAVFGGLLMLMSSQASDVELTTAKLVPADAAMYVAINADLTSSQWLSAFKLIERLGQQDPQGELKRAVSENGGLDWEHDVAPFLGGNAAIYLKHVDLSGLDLPGAIIIRCNDSAAALKVVTTQAGGKFSRQSYGGYTIQESADLSFFVVQIEDHLVIAMDEAAVREVIDVRLGKAPSLAGRDDFRTLRDELAKDFLSFAYVSTDALLSDTLFSDPVVRKALQQSDTADMATKPVAFVVGARENAFQFQEASMAKSGSVAPLLEPRTSRLAKLVPEDTVIFFSTANVAQTWSAVRRDAGKQIDDAIAQEGEYRNLDDALQSAGRELGLTSLQEVIDLFSGETAVAVWYPNGQRKEEFAVLAEVKDGATAQAVLDKVAVAASSSKPATRQVNGTKVTSSTDSSGDTTAYAVKDGVLFLGSDAGVELALKGAGGKPLSSLGRYQETVSQMPSKLGTFIYFDLNTLVRLTGADGTFPQLDEAQQVLQGAILNVVQERGIPRVSGAITIK